MKPTTMTAKRKKQETRTKNEERRTKNEGNTGWDLRLLRLPFTNVFTNVFTNPSTSTFTTTRAYPGHIQGTSNSIKPDQNAEAATRISLLIH
ncbi:MAG: hypothetical protein GOMPHAMPRED_002696 [Gomphillus americanus]|uniref:Uncharacterized protein n=1 Tax=Gomphillus americanus TaxID=1940652 RepID=A0A8H3IPS8_9LECA|nr:MAG: hypothetical protein GOMPHAMPRED_002696 [Gomphillus americanus]